MEKFELLVENELFDVNGGSKKDRDFGQEVGHDVSRVCHWVWTHTIGCTTVY